MHRVLAIIAALAALTLAACGGSSTTTVIEPTTTTSTTTETTTEDPPATDDSGVSDPWPANYQRVFIKGFGRDPVQARCVLDNLMQLIPYSQLNINGNMVDRYRTEIVKAAIPCV